MPESTPELTALGNRLFMARMRMGLSQLEAGRRAGMARGHLGRLENGLCEPGVLTVAKLADLYGLSMDALLERTSGNNKEKDHG